MKFLPDHIKTDVFKFLHREMPLEEFEQWVYATKDLEEIFSKEDYGELLSVDYSKNSNRYDVIKLVTGYINEGEYETWKLKKLLNAVINNNGDLQQVFVDFYDLYCDGYRFLDNLGLGYGLSVVVPPSEYSSDSWEKLSEQEKKRLLASFFPGALNEVKRVLSWLKDGTIVILNEQDGLGHFKYLDQRSEEEKMPTAYIIAEPSVKGRIPKWWKFWSKKRGQPLNKE